MFLLNFIQEGQIRLGVRSKSGVIDVASAAAALSAEAEVPTSMRAVIEGGQAAQQALTAFVTKAEVQSGADWLLDEATRQLSHCLAEPEKILCVGLNYRRHAEESGMAVPETPILFSKFNNALAAPGESVPLPGTAKEYDYEVELAVVIGREARYVAEDDALSYVFGYCTANDISARDLQFRTAQWLLGKTLDKFAPIGPYLVTADEVADPQNLKLSCWVNGDLRQNSNTADMIFSVAQVISYASQYMTLKAGDVILTGTPEGVIAGMANKVWLKPGDEVTVEVGNLGKLTNPLIGD